MRNRSNHEEVGPRRVRQRISSLIASALAVTAAAGCIGILAPSASAACPHGGNFNSTACTFGSGGDYRAAESNFHDNNMYLNNYTQGRHINQEMWAYTRSDWGQWIEMGLRNGITSGDSCGCVAYTQFWAEFDTGGNEHIHAIANISPDGVSHVYEVMNRSLTKPVTTWDIYLDYNHIGTSGYQTTARIYTQQAGMELGTLGVNSGSHADNFDNYMQVYKPNIGWVYWASEDLWIDYPCDSTNRPPNCLNGIGNGTYEWSDSKP